MEQALHLKPSSDGLDVSSMASNRSVTVRPANLDDLDFLVSEAKVFSDFYGTKQTLFPGEERARFGFKNLIDQHFVRISEIKGVKTGFVAGYFVTHGFNPDIKVLSECFWWVKQEFRMGRSGLVLLKKFIEFGKQNASWITFSLEHHSPVNAKTLLKHGFKFHEQGYLLEVE